MGSEVNWLFPRAHKNVRGIEIRAQKTSSSGLCALCAKLGTVCPPVPTAAGAAKLKVKCQAREEEPKALLINMHICLYMRTC